MPEVKRQVKLVTEQKIIEEANNESDFPLRAWSISVFILDVNTGSELPATCFQSVTYKLHESFGKEKATQVKRSAPFLLAEEGWGEFEMLITFTPLGNPKGGDTTVVHDLHFQQERYESFHTVAFRNPKPELAERLRESGPVGDTVAPGVTQGDGVAKDGFTKVGPGKAANKKKTNRAVDMEKLADGLQKLGEDDLLHVVQLVHDNKTEDTYTKNDVENGEFLVDLYTLPDQLVKALWDFTFSKVQIESL